MTSVSMNHPGSFVLGMAACALVASTLIAAAPVNKAQAQVPTSAQPAATTTTVPEDPAAGAFTQTCAKCHDGARITAMRRTSAEWEDAVKKLIEKGAPGTEKEFETAYHYLLRNYGKLNINGAAATAIVTPSALPPHEPPAHL